MVVQADRLPWLEQPLAQALLARRDHHALLIHGPRGVGQLELALALASAWLCEGERAMRPCGRCPSCLLVNARSHPDLLVLLPETLRVRLGWTSTDDDAEAPAKKPSKEVRVDAIRGAVEFAETTSARGHAKVVVIYPAERMGPVAANALLKTLEEPPGLARFALATGDHHALPATLRSRCQALHLPAPPIDVGCRWLTAQGVKEPQGLLAAAGGAPLEALAWSEDGGDTRLLQELPDAVLRGDAGSLAGWPLPRAVDVLQKLCHDLLLGSVGVEPRYFAQIRLLPRASARPLQAWADALARAACHAEHPWNAGLLIESLVSQGRRACQGLPPEERPRGCQSVHSSP